MYFFIRAVCIVNNAIIGNLFYAFVLSVKVYVVCFVRVCFKIRLPIASLLWSRVAVVLYARQANFCKNSCIMMVHGCGSVILMVKREEKKNN
jgi:hypothetical protein